MSSHHGHHRSSHHSRSRMHHSSSHYPSHNRSRISSAKIDGGGGCSAVGSNGIVGGIPSSNHRNNSHGNTKDSPSCDWQEHKSSSGKVYYYNARTGVSQWEIPAELRQHQQQQQQQSLLQQRLASPESDMSESSSIRQQQENSPSSNASSHNSAQSFSVIEDKPLLTPSLAAYYKPELIVNYTPSLDDELLQQSNQLDREIILLNERLLKERVEIKICKSNLEFATTQAETLEKKCASLRKTIERFGISSYP